jgi:mono/diheme cytochrome c family protein
MQRSVPVGVLFATVVLGAAAVLAADKPDVARGKKLYISTGCYQCHGTTGEGGGNAGPRVAPSPMPYEGFLQQIRKPRARMPFYTAVVMPDKDVTDIYAYLLTIPKGKTPDEIPMLKTLTAGAGSKQ